MRKIFSIILYILIPFHFTFGQTLKFETSLDKAFQKAEKENKIVFIKYYNDDCTVCKSIEPLFSNPKMMDFYEKNFVSYSINTKNELNQQENHLLLSNSIHLTGVPYFLFFDSQKQFIHYSGAKNDLEYLISIAETAMDEEKRTGSLAQKFTNGDRSIRTLYAYSNLLQIQNKLDKNDEVTNELFKVYPKHNLPTHQSYLILKNNILDIENGFFKFWYQNQDRLIGMEKGSNKGNEKLILENILLKSVQSDRKNHWDLSVLNEVEKMLLKMNITTDPLEFLWEQKLNHYLRENKGSDSKELIHHLLESSSNNILSQLFYLETIVEKKLPLELQEFILEEINILLQNNAMNVEHHAEFLSIKHRIYVMANRSKEANQTKVELNNWIKKHKINLEEE